MTGVSSEPIGRCSVCHRQVIIKMACLSRDIEESVMTGDSEPEILYVTCDHFLDGGKCVGSGQHPDSDSLEI